MQVGDDVQGEATSPKRLFVRDASDAPDPTLLAFRMSGLPRETVRTSDIGWGERFHANLLSLARQARDVGGPNGRSLPYASLRAALQARLKPLYLGYNVALGTASKNQDGRFLHLETTDGSAAVEAVRDVVRMWLDNVVNEWAARLELDMQDVTNLQEDVDDADALVHSEGAITLSQLDVSDFLRVREALFAVLARRIGGMELFPGLGPVRRIVRSGLDNEISFETWPQLYKDTPWSMVATLRFATVPGVADPTLQCRASRRRWMTAIPPAEKLRYSRRSISAHIMLEKIPEIAVETSMRLASGDPVETLDPSFVLQKIETDTVLPSSLREMVRETSSAAKDVFVGVPYSTSYQKKFPVGFGASTRDCAELFETLAPVLDRFNMTPLQGEVVSVKGGGRNGGFHKKITTDHLLAYLNEATAAGEEDADSPDIDALSGILKEISETEGEFKADSDAVRKAFKELGDLRAANQDRIKTAYHEMKPGVVCAAREEAQRRFMAECVQTLFGDAVDTVCDYALPKGAHGSRAMLDPKKEMGFSERYAHRYEAWTTLAEGMVAGGHEGSHVLVQEKDFFDAPDDSTSKPSGRAALAGKADCNSQWLLPPAGRSISALGDYLYRLQSAVYDLLLGHIGHVESIKDSVDAAFPDPETCPGTVLAFAVVRLSKQSRRRGGEAAKVLVAMSVDRGEQRTWGKAAWAENGRLVTSPWTPMNTFLKKIADRGVLTIGESKEEETRYFQAFVKKTIEEKAEEKVNPLVLVDATNARMLWPYLKNRTSPKLEFPALKHGEVDRATWKNVRIVRVDRSEAGRIVERKTIPYAEVCSGNPEKRTQFVKRVRGDTINPRIVRVSSLECGGACYWATLGYRMHGLRGRSVFRDVETMRGASDDEVSEVVDIGEDGEPEATKTKLYVEHDQKNALYTKSYLLPNVLEISVLKIAEDDDSDRIARLVHDLRSGYGHHDADTALPAPLSFRSKVEDYLARFVVPSDDDDPDPDVIHIDEAEIDQEPREGKPSGEDDPLPHSSAEIGARMGRDVEQAPNESEMEGKMAGELETDRQGCAKETSRKLSLMEIRKPVLSVPSLVDQGWVRHNINPVPAMLREVTRRREEMTAISGFDWPDRIPTKEEACDLFLDGLRYPLFMRAFYRLGLPKKKRSFKKFNLYRSLWMQTGKTWRRVRRMVDDGEIPFEHELGKVAEALVEDRNPYTGEVIWALAPMFHRCDMAHLRAAIQRHEKEIGAVAPGIIDICNALEGYELDAVRDFFDENPLTAWALDEGGHPFEPEDNPETTVGSDENACPTPGEVSFDNGDVEGNDGNDSAFTGELDALVSEWEETLRSIREVVDAAAEPSREAANAVAASASRLQEMAAAWVSLPPERFNISALVEDVSDDRDGIVKTITSAKLLDEEEELCRRVDDMPSSVAPVDKEEVERLVAGFQSDADALVSAVIAREKARDIEDTDEMIAALQRANQDLEISRKQAFSTLASLLEVCGVPAVEDGSMRRIEDEAGDERDQPATEDSFENEAPEDFDAEDEQDIYDSDPNEETLDDLDDDEDPETEENRVEDIEAVEIGEEALENERIEVVNRRLRQLFQQQEYGAAHHLVLAATASLHHRGFDFTDAELRLAATAGLAHAATYAEVRRYADALSEALSVAHILVEDENEESDLRTARRIALFASVIEFALYTDGTEHTAIALINTLVNNGVGRTFYDLYQAVERNRQKGFQLTPSNLYAASSTEMEEHAQEMKEHILRRGTVLAEGRKNYASGEKVQGWLCASKGPVGQLLKAIDTKKGVAVAKNFAASYRTSAAAEELITKAEKESGAPNAIYGSGRVKFRQQISELAGLCKNWVAAREAIDKKEGSKSIIGEIGGMVEKGCERALGRLDQMSDGAYGPLTDSAVALATGVITRLKETALGKRAPQVDHIRQMVALHGPLLWIPQLEYSGGWTSNASSADRVLDGVLNGLPPLRSERHEFENIEAAVEARMKEGSFLAARMLIIAAKKYGIHEASLTSLEGRIELAVETRRAHLDQKKALALQGVHRARRYAFDEANELARLEERLLEINPEEIGESHEFEPFELEDEAVRIEDFIAAEGQLAEVSARVQGILEIHRENVLSRLAGLRERFDDEKEFEARRQEIVRLLDKNELATADEILTHIEQGEAVTVTDMIQPKAYEEFFEEFKVPQTLEGVGYDLSDIEAAIKQRRNFADLPFSSIEEQGEALEALTYWAEFRKTASSRITAQQVIANVSSMLSHFGLAVSDVTPMPDRSNAKRGEYIGNMTINIEGSQDSLLLPDFGSQTSGAWRVSVFPTMPQKDDFARLCKDAQHAGVLIIVPKVVKAEQREAAAVNLMREGYRALVIDEALFLYALAQPRFRALTMIEVAQAFSYAEPYEDKGNLAVPPEMFKGRREEQREIMSSDSGFLVYGGCRLGKTALLRHVTNTAHEPSQGRICAFISLHETESRNIWQLGSMAMPDIFDGKEVLSGAEFSKRVRAWLEKSNERRVILMVDEANDFVRSDQEEGFAQFKQLQKLMSDTNVRFKVVLSGLHNIARMVRTSENAPISHISRDVLRIGPMMREDAADAEALVTAPLAGLGYRFADRTDVWRILSFCNYYPILIQLVGKNLVKQLRSRAKTENRVVRTIDSEMVSAVLNAKDTLTEIQKGFDKTLGLDDQRYRLLTYVVAKNMIQKADDKALDDGVTAREVRIQAAGYWPAAIDSNVTDDDIAGLLDELEGLGLLRQVRENRWTLRSRSIVSFIGGRDIVKERLEGFRDLAQPNVFDPRSNRRIIKKKEGRGPAVRSPLTAGQEYDLLRNDGYPVRLAFGIDLAAPDDVVNAIRSAPLVANARKSISKATNVRSFARELSTINDNGAMRTVVVVHLDRPWTSEWVRKAMESSAARNGKANIIFIGGPMHARSWTGARVSFKRVVQTTLMPWRVMLTESILRHAHVTPPHEHAAKIHELTGGWSHSINTIVQDDTNERALQKAIREEGDRLSQDEDLLKRLGLAEERPEIAGIASVIRGFIEAYEDTARHFQKENIADFIKEFHGRFDVTADEVVDYMLALGLAEVGTDNVLIINPLALRVFQKVEEAA